MSAQFQLDPSTSLYELRVQGLLSRQELAGFETQLAAAIDAGAQPRIRVLLENFQGWQRGDDWNNFDFMFNYGDKIAKIAIVGAGSKEAEVKAFTGAGLRPTPVKFFAADQSSDAQAWLLE